MQNKSILAKILLLPCSKLYGLGVYLRNKFFDWGLLKETSFDIPVICVGNIAAGGTGKTPLVEHIIGLFCSRYKIAVLSRGYRRTTKGFIMAGASSTPRDIGDESYQIFKKFYGKIHVAVCEDRVVGIKELLRLDPSINLIILDDAFQHRFVKPAISIVASEYLRPIYEDSLLPYGRLRESIRGINRADIVVVTKCPPELKPLDYSLVAKHYDLIPQQSLFFSRYQYQPLQPVFPDVTTSVPYLDWLSANDTILAIAGIGNPRPFIFQVKSFLPKVKVDIFKDHHDYTKKDIEHIRKRFQSLKGKTCIIVTTEKDAVRLATNPYYPYELKSKTFYLPIQVNIEPWGKDASLEETIEKLISEHKRRLIR